MIRLLNSAVMPRAGVYSARVIDRDEFAVRLRLAVDCGELRSYIGYEETARFVERVAGVAIHVSREPTSLDDGDTMLVARVRYRVDPRRKGAPLALSDGDFEFLLVEFREERQAADAQS